MVWPTDLAPGANDAGVLLRASPAGPFVAETKVHFDGVRGNHQAGLVIYEWRVLCLSGVRRPADGLVAMGGTGATARFDYVHTYGVG